MLTNFTKVLLAIFLFSTIVLEPGIAEDARAPVERRQRRNGRRTESQCRRTLRSSLRLAATCNQFDFSFCMNGNEEFPSFYCIFLRPSEFANSDAVCRRVRTGLRPLGLDRMMVDSLVEHVAIWSPQFYEQIPENAELICVRILVEGPWNFDEALIDAGFELDEQVHQEHDQKQELGKLLDPDLFESAEAERNNENQMFFDFGDGNRFDLPPKILDEFSNDGTLSKYSGTFHVQIDKKRRQVIGLSGLLSDQAIKNSSEAARVTQGTGEKKRRMPVIVFSYLYPKEASDRSQQLDSSQIGINSVAFEFCPRQGNVWSIQSSHLQFDAFVELLGIEQSVAIPPTELYRNEPLQREFDGWLLDHGGQRFFSNKAAVPNDSPSNERKDQTLVSRSELIARLYGGDFDNLMKKIIRQEGLSTDLEEFSSDVIDEVRKSDEPINEKGSTSWLLKVIRNVAVNTWRNKSKETRTLSHNVLEGTSTDYRLDRPCFLRRRKALELFVEQNPWVLKYLDAMTGGRAEAAKKKGWTLNEVKKYRADVRAKCRRNLDSPPDEN